MAEVSASEGQKEGAAESAQKAGRGGIAIAIAKVSFILFGFAQQLILSKVAGDAGYGELRRVLGVVGIVNNVIVGAAIQGVSRSVSSAPSAAGAAAAFRKTLTVHALFAIVAAAGFAGSAGFVADFMQAPHVALPMRIVAVVVLLYGFYAPLVGALNGGKRFLAQAGLDIGYGALRLATTAAGALVFKRAGASPVVGAVVGFAVAALVIVPVALSRAGTGRAGASHVNTREYLGFLGPLVVGQIFLNALLQTDMVLLSRSAGLAARAAGVESAAADVLVGSYGAVQLFALLPYQMLISISFVLFPMLARARADGDSEGIARYTATGMRVAFVIAGAMCGTIAALGPLVLRLVFSEEFVKNGGAALRFHAVGMGAFAILGIACALLTSLGRERVSAALTASAVVLVAAGCAVLVPRAPFGPAMLTASAIATGSALAVTAVAAAFALRGVAGAFAPVLTMARVALATGVTVACGVFVLPYKGKAFVLVEAAAMALVYVLVLVVTGELGRADAALVAGVVKRRAAKRA